MIFINDLISWCVGENENSLERIIWMDEGNVIAYTIDVDDNKVVPKLRRISEIKDSLESGIASKIDIDPYAVYTHDDDLNLKHKEIRDQAWTIISNIVEIKNEPAIYSDRKFRGSLIKQAAQDFNVTDRVIYKYLAKYWKRGKNKNALLPDFNKCGGKGKEKKLGAKKVGRPRKNAEIVGAGINVDESTKQVFRIAIDRFFHTQKEIPFTTAYEIMLKEFYTEDYRFQNGIKIPIMIPPEQIPTIDQFKYWYYKEQNIKQTLQARKGSKKYELKHRAILGNSENNIIGPGSKYQIDATIGDIYLVSRYNRNWIIGRPVIYVVIDVLSRMIVGLYVGLEGPSWLGAMMALVNATTNKVDFCKEYGVNINEEDWPCHHLPEAILADRGEMEGKAINTLINNLHVRIENTPPYRADWKGIVEQYFNTINGKIKPLLPGFVDVDFRERGGKDYRLDAKLDIFQFTQIIIKCIINHNTTNWMKGYNRDEMMIQDNVEPIPIELWNWGIANRSGRLRTFPEEIIKLNLMPRDHATVTERGIRYKRMYYSCENAIQEMWFEKARNKGYWKVDISYDPRNMDYIYIRTLEGRNFEKCRLIDDNRFADKTIDEIDYLLAYERLEKEKRSGKVMQSKIDLITEVEEIVNMAEKMTIEQKDATLSKSGRVTGIKQHRINEKLENRRNEAFELLKDEAKKQVKDNVVTKIYSDEDDESELPETIEFLRRKQKERLHGKKE